MFNIPRGLPMPNNEQCSFHTPIGTFHKIIRLKPKLYTPTHKASAHTEIDPDYTKQRGPDTHEPPQVIHPIHLASILRKDAADKEPTPFSSIARSSQLIVLYCISVKASTATWHPWSSSASTNQAMYCQSTSAWKYVSGVGSSLAAHPSGWTRRWRRI